MKNKGLKTIILVMIMITCSVIFTGCWDSVEINRRHVVLEIAIDKNKDETSEDVYEVTYTIPNIAKLSGENSVAEDAKTSISTKSKTLAGSIDEVNHKAQNTVSFSHTKAVIMSKEILEDKRLLEGVLDGLVRNMQIARGTSILVSDEEAKKITETSVGENPMIGLYIMKYFNNKERPINHAKQQTLGTIIKEINNNDITTVPVIKSKDDNIILEGAAVIKDYEVQSWLDKDQVKGQLFVEGKINKSPITIKYRGHDLTYNIDKQSSSIHFTDTDKQDGVNTNDVSAKIEINVIGSIVEYSLFEDDVIFNEDSMEEINALIGQEIKDIIQATIDYSKEINVDFLNIGLELYRHKPDAWESYKENWDAQGYKDMPIDIETSVVINNTGVLK